MNKKLKKSFLSFYEHFGYTPKYPNEIDFDQDEYADLLDKCVNDDFDYTIEKYGTDPTYGTEPHDGIYID